MANSGHVNDNWKRWVLVWLLAVIGLWILTPFGFWGTLTGTAGLVCIFWGIRALHRAVAARSIEETTVGLLGGQSTPVQLVGDARPVREPLTAPLTDTECVAYQIEIKEYRPSSTDGGE